MDQREKKRKSLQPMINPMGFKTNRTKITLAHGRLLMLNVEKFCSHGFVGVGEKGRIDRKRDVGIGENTKLAHGRTKNFHDQKSFENSWKFCFLF